MDLGPHAHFIWISYAVVTAAVALLITWLIVDGRRLERLTADLEKRGLGRRSNSTKASNKS